MGPDYAPRSAKKWARSAHLHEVRGRAARARGRQGKDGEDGEDASPPWLVSGRPTSAPSPTGRVSDGNDSAASGGEVDAWVDTDVDGSEADSDGQMPLQEFPTLTPLSLVIR